MSLDIHIEGLGLKLRVRRIVNSRDSFSRRQVMQIIGKLSKFGPGLILVLNLLLFKFFAMVHLEHFTHLFILVGDVKQVALTSVEVMFVLTTVVATVTAK